MTDPGRRTDSELMRRVAAGDDRALAELYDRHGTMVYSLALAIVADTADAEEVVADVFLQAWRAAETFDHTRGSVAAWLPVIARSRALDRLRARRRRASTLEAAAAAAPDGLAIPLAMPASVHEEAGARATLERLEGAVAALPETQRRCIELAYFQGLTQTEIAAQ